MKFLKTIATWTFACTVGLAAAPLDTMAKPVSADSLVRVTAVRDAYPFWSPDARRLYLLPIEMAKPAAISISI